MRKMGIGKQNDHQYAEEQINCFSLSQHPAQEYYFVYLVTVPNEQVASAQLIGLILKLKLEKLHSTLRRVLCTYSAMV